ALQSASIASVSRISTPLQSKQLNSPSAVFRRINKGLEFNQIGSERSN
ncbi:unnamed protein product, partial [Tenebrio molitor]